MKQFCCTLLFFLATLTSYAQNFADFFQDKTLRVDYIFTGDANRQAIYLDELSQLPSWAGRQRTSLGGKRANYRERRCHRTMYL